MSAAKVSAGEFRRIEAKGGVTERAGAGSSRSVAPKTGGLLPGYKAQNGEKFHCT